STRWGLGSSWKSGASASYSRSDIPFASSWQNNRERSSAPNDSRGEIRPAAAATSGVNGGNKKSRSARSTLGSSILPPRNRFSDVLSQKRTSVLPAETVQHTQFTILKAVQPIVGGI